MTLVRCAAVEQLGVVGAVRAAERVAHEAAFAAQRWNSSASWGRCVLPSESLTRGAVTLVRSAAVEQLGVVGRCGLPSESLTRRP